MAFPDIHGFPQGHPGPNEQQMGDFIDYVVALGETHKRSSICPRLAAISAAHKLAGPDAAPGAETRHARPQAEEGSRATRKHRRSPPR